MNRRDKLICARYGVDVREINTHTEANNLAQVLTALDGAAGKAQVIDRQTGRIVFTGTVDEVRDAVNASVDIPEDGTACADG